MADTAPLSRSISAEVPAQGTAGTVQDFVIGVAHGGYTIQVTISRG